MGCHRLIVLSKIHTYVTFTVLAPLPAPINLSASAEANSISLTWEQPPYFDGVESYEITYNYTVHECKAGSDQDFSSTVNVTLPGFLRNYTILNSTATPVEEDSTYAISLTAANNWSTGERSEAATVVIKTFRAS